MKTKISEIIICAANWYADMELIRPEVLDVRGNRPYNIDKGIVFSGWRHHNCLYQMVAVTGKRQSEIGKEVQGFLTNKNRFVDRKEAAEIALKSGQIKKLTYSSAELYSEDLY